MNSSYSALSSSSSDADRPSLVLKEPLDIRLARFLLHQWPFVRGRGIIARALSPLWRSREFLVAVERGIFVPADLEDYMVYWVFANGYDNDAVVRLSRELIRAGDTVLDIGANIGLWAMGAARKADEGTVHAFEPVAANYERLEANIALNRIENIRAASVALSDRAGRAQLFLPSYNNSGHPSLGHRDGVETPVEVDVTTIDEYCERYDIAHVDFIKSDVEGAEYLVFRGAQRLLASDDGPVVLFEVNETTAATLGTSVTDVKELLTQKGYRLFRFERHALRRRLPAESEEPGDLFAFRPHHVERFPQLERLGVTESW